MACYKLYITGRVQGVGFRFFTYQQAQKQNLTGYVENLPDGRVKIILCGEETALNTFKHWLENDGIRSAKIEQIDCTSISPDDIYTDFQIHHASGTY